MFSQSFVDGANATRKPYTVALSLLLQIAVICLLILAPLLYTQALPNAQLKSMLMAPAPPPPVFNPPTVVKPRSSRVVRSLSSVRLVAPVIIPKHLNTIVEIPRAPDLGTSGSATDANVNGNPLLFGSTVGPADSQPPPFAPASKPNKPSGRLRIGGVVAEANIIHKVQPVYPPLAKSARVQGAVEFTALISKQGRVENLQFVRGHPLLVNAARQAILEWQYRPTMLNGEAVEVLTSITVNFQLTE